MRALRGFALAAVALTVLSTLTSSPVGAQTAPGPDDIPALGTFSYSGSGGLSEYRGIVHGVRRVPGGTAVYYSLGVAAGQPFSSNLIMADPRVSTSYVGGDAYAVEVLDLRGRRIYRPMVGPEGCLCPEVFDFGSDSGTLKVGWAVLPPLPADVTTVNVQVGYGIVENIAVQEGALLPAMTEMTARLGTGWPALPSDAQVAAVPQPDRFVRALIRHTADLERTVAMNEQPGRVAEDLSADVLFTVGSATLSPAARATLQQVAGRVKMRATGQVTVVGHTDATGSDQDNQQLSEARARAVRDALQPDVGASVTLVASGRGEAEPVADDANPEGRQLNRRVTVTYSFAEGS